MTSNQKLKFAVTGVASGIGAAIASELSRRGHFVVGFDVQPTTENLDFFIQLDLDNPAAIIDAVEKVPCDLNGLCNNAGLPPRTGTEVKILQVNFLAQRELTQAMLPHLVNDAVILNLASRAGAQWRENIDQVTRLSGILQRDYLEEFVVSEKLDATGCYNLSKQAMIAWTIAMNESLIQQGLRINCLSPGAVSTGILDDFANAFGERMRRNVERAGRPARPQEIALVAAFLLSSESHWLKGVDIPIDGGMGAFALSDAMSLDRMLIP